MFSDWILNGYNLIAFVFVVYAMIYMMFALVSYSHLPTLFVCLFIIVLCCACAAYFLSSRCMRRQEPI